MNRKAQLITVMALVAVTTFTGCKKGEEDPFISLRSRTSRITGEWLVNSFETTENSTNSSSTNNVTSTGSTTQTHKYDGTTYSVSGSTTNQNTTVNDAPGTGKATISYLFEKDGSVKMTRSTEITSEQTVVQQNSPSTGWTTTTVNTVTTTENMVWTGTWNFLDGIGKELKKRESIVINYLAGSGTTKTDTKTVNTYTSASGVNQTYTTYTNGSDTRDLAQELTAPSETWHLIELSNKKIQAETVWNSKESVTSNMSYTDPSGQVTTNPTVQTTNETQGRTMMVLGAK
jgi:hypothetical protein